jgi:hypothetical protein
MFRLRGVALSAAVITFVAGSTANAAEYFGFTLGMSEVDALALAKRSGYEFEPTPGQPGQYIQMGHSGPDYLSFCGGRLFSVGQTFDGDFPAFIGLVRERQARWGEPIWTVEQSYVSQVQPLKQLSILKAQWDDTAGRIQPELSLMSYGKSLRITTSYSAHKYLCSGPPKR